MRLESSFVGRSIDSYFLEAPPSLGPNNHSLNSRVSDCFTNSRLYTSYCYQKSDGQEIRNLKREKIRLYSELEEVIRQINGHSSNSPIKDKSDVCLNELYMKKNMIVNKIIPIRWLINYIIQVKNSLNSVKIKMNTNTVVLSNIENSLALLRSENSLILSLSRNSWSSRGKISRNDNSLADFLREKQKNEIEQANLLQKVNKFNEQLEQLKKRSLKLLPPNF